MYRLVLVGSFFFFTFPFSGELQARNDKVEGKQRGEVNIKFNSFLQHLSKDSQ